jgi:hypothetical protein
MGDGSMNSITYVGLDVHKATISVAVAEGRRGGEVRHIGVFPNHPDHIAKLVERLSKGGRRLSLCYEAGPCGYGLHRQLTELGHDCIVVAPSLSRRAAWDCAFPSVYPDRVDGSLVSSSLLRWRKNRDQREGEGDPQHTRAGYFCPRARRLGNGR